MLCINVSWAAETGAPSDATVVNGQVLEVTNVESYTYLRLQTKDGEIWAAVPSAQVTKGVQVTIVNATVMDDFQSKSLKRTFDHIVFGTLADARMPGSAGTTNTAAPGNIKVSKASGPGARTVAEIVTKSAELKDKTILVRGQVVKYSEAVMGKNWVHLRDGTGSATDNSNDVLVTTRDAAKVGDVVVAKGVVRTDKDFGSGYSYKVLVEDASLQK